jgi:pimeloyl-ACP methyl ester carboxylesterase
MEPAGRWQLDRPDGAELSIHELGSGPPVVLVHGTACDHRVWARVARRLAPRFTLHVPDRRGRGDGSEAEEWSLETDARDVAAIADEVGEDVPVVGHSMGAIVAIEAARHGDAVGSLVAYEPPVHGGQGPPVAAADELAAILEEEGPDAAVEAFLRQVGYGDEQLGQLRQHEQLWAATVATAPTLPREVRADLAYAIDDERLASIGSTVLLLEGEQSPSDFDEGLDRLARALPDVERRVIDDATHAILYEAPGAFADAIEDFLAEQG